MAAILFNDKKNHINIGGDAIFDEKTTCTSKKKSPPIIGKESAVTRMMEELDEDSSSKSSFGSDIGESLRSTDSPLTVTSETSSDTLLTEKVLAEETKMEKLDQKEEEEEEAAIQKTKELWKHMDTETKEMRYQRLQKLLAKSNMYTEYLLQRMDRQKEEEQHRRELEDRRAKKLKKEQGEQKKPIVEAENIKTPEVTPTASQKTEPDQSTQEKADANLEKSPPASQGRRRMSLRAPLPRSQLSSPSTPLLSEAGSQPSTPQVGGAKEERTEEPLTLSPPNEKENQGGVRRSGRRKSAAPEQKVETPKRGLKRRNDGSPSEQSKQATPVLTNFFKPVSKKRKVDEAEGKDKTATGKTKDKKVKEPPLPYGVSEKDTDGNVLKPYLFTGGDLRKYQMEGLNWLRILFANGVNGILADEMGLGKTVQCIAALSEFIAMGSPGPFIVVAPLSTLPNWTSEFQRFAPRIPVLFYHGTKEDRAKIRRKMYRKHTVMEGVQVQPVVLTSFEIAMRDRPFLKDIDWCYLIVDEGHRLKNKNCRLIRELKQYKTAYRLLLTGTPLQNNLSELWSLLNFLLPEIFDDLGSFETWFDIEAISDVDADEAIIREEKKSNILGMLHQILTPFMLRRVKTDVDLQIPPKKEILVYAPMSEFQKDFYESTVDKTILQKLEDRNKKDQEQQEAENMELTTLGRPKRFAARKSVDYKAMLDTDNDDDSDIESWVEAVVENNKPMEKQEKKKRSKLTVSLQNIIMQLRKVVNHPYLIEYPLDAAGEYKVDEDVVKKCGKMMLLDKMLSELKSRGHKVLIFSQMTKMMDIIEDMLGLRGHTYCRLDGSTHVEDRRIAMDAFNKDPNMFVFLLSTRAGGLGINLVGGDTVIIYDSDWNPQNDLQAQDRCHRIGQTRPVMVYRLVTANTIDQKIVERAAAKRKLEKMVIKKGKFKSGISNFTSEMKPINPEELKELLKSRDYSDEVGKESSSVISKKDLDALLDRTEMIEDFEKIKKGVEVESEEKEEDLLKTSSTESRKIFKTVDYDPGELTLAKKG